MPRSWPAVLLSIVLVPGFLQASSEIGHEDFVVEISDHGVLVTVPQGGIVTVDGPRAELSGDFGEWYGVSFTRPDGRVERVGIGRSADWAGRSPVDPVDAWASESASTVIARAGEMDIRTDWSIDPLGPYLVARVTLTNRSRVVLRNILYTREWQQLPGGGWTLPENNAWLSPAPDDIARNVWMLDDLQPGASTDLTFSYMQAVTEAPSGSEVPLSLWTDGTYPLGLPIGETNGISWGDYDADGYIDIFACQSANLWRNVNGTTWELAADLDSELPAADYRYGASFGDYNLDGLPDIGTEPRTFGEGDEFFHLLKNLGGGPNFDDVAIDPAIIDVLPFGDSETLCWGDVNCDGYLDLFVPVYPEWSFGNPGNFFLFNLGPTGPGGAYRFTESSAAAGLDNPPPDSARPEGAQFVDVDFDGDMDLYSNGTLYQNVSTHQTPLFGAMIEAASGIGLSTSLDEGAALFDYDLDGDYDLAIVYSGPGVRIWEAYGDGMYFEPRDDLIDSPMTGLTLGLSAEDWDNDGDIDFTTRQVFRRNRLIEDGERHFTVASTSIPPQHLVLATPAWGDWDKDGDLDCALGNWTGEGHFYENTLYSAVTPDEQRRHLRVRAVGNSPTVAAGLEDQYATSVEVHLLNGPDTYRRKKFVASSHGYLNQNEYTLHFALPQDPAPGDPAEDLHLDLTLDFPSLPEDGLWRVDKFVNPALGDVNLADLDDREVKVYRCGQVVIDGVLYEPSPLASPTLKTTTGGLALSTPAAPLPAPTQAPLGPYFVGLSFNTANAAESIRVKELILDGALGPPSACGPETANVALWDVTNPGSPFIVPGGAFEEAEAPRNRRHYIRTDVVLDPGRYFRLVMRARKYRATTMAAPVDHGPIEVTGGLLYQDSSPCSGAAVAAATEIPTEAYLALRFDAAGIASEQPDPTGDSLRLGKNGTKPDLEWIDLTLATGYEILRCDAGAGPCEPAPYDSSTVNSYTDEDLSGDQIWYEVRAAAECQAPGSP